MLTVRWYSQIFAKQRSSIDHSLASIASVDRTLPHLTRWIDTVLPPLPAVYVCEQTVRQSVRILPCQRKPIKSRNLLEDNRAILVFEL